MKLERVKAAEDTRIAPNADHPMTWTEYHSTEDINAYLEYLQTTYPDLVSAYQTRAESLSSFRQFGHSLEKTQPLMYNLLCLPKCAFWTI